jgi:hypothetical protein
LKLMSKPTLRPQSELRSNLSLGRRENDFHGFQLNHNHLFHNQIDPVATAQIHSLVAHWYSYLLFV